MDDIKQPRKIQGSVGIFYTVKAGCHQSSRTTDLALQQQFLMYSARVQMRDKSRRMPSMITTID